MTGKVGRWSNSVSGQVLRVMVGLIALGTAGCAGRLVTSAVENRIEDRLPELIGPARSYEVKVRGSARDAVRGRISRIDIRGEQVWAMPDLCLDRLDVRMRDVVSDPQTSELKNVGDISFKAIVSETSLNDYFLRTRTDDLEVELLDGQIIAHVRPKVLRVPVSVKLTGPLVARGATLDFRVEHLEVAGIGSPSIAADAVEKRINPVLDLKFVEFSPVLTSATIVPGAVWLSGTAHLSNR